MKKTIVILGLALVAFTNVTFASTSNSTPIKMEATVLNGTPLCVAIMKGDTETVKKFIEYGADVNELSNGLTPLMMAARYNKAEIVTLLLSKGAKIDTKDERGFTALKYAEYSKATEAITALKNA
ncbi:MAG: ankyrin repeat domain-containing protein [Bacteroidota bacterium]